MHKRFVSNIIARVVLFVALVMLIPLAWGIFDDVHSREVGAFLITIISGIIISGIFLFVFQIKKEDYKKINAKDGLAIVGLSWIVLSFFGAFPLYLSGVVETYTDALFEIASGFTTTGSTIFTDIESLPRGILFWRSLTHWLGGMGIIVLYIALLPALGTQSSQLYKAEAPGLMVERVEPRIKETAKNLWAIYFLLSFLEVIFLMLCKMPLFDALCHTFGTMATGGFSTKNASMGAYGANVQWVVLIFMVLAGVNFILHYQFLRGHFKAPWKNEEFRFYIFIILILTPIFTIVLKLNTFSLQPFRESLFQIVSILTTTGYTTVNFNLWPTALQVILVILMFLGGCGGSTGGGMKVIRFLLAIKVALCSIVQAVFPNAILPVKFNGKALEDKLIMAVLSYFIIFILLFLFGALLFSITESCDVVTALTASLSALSNIGPGLGQVGAAENFAWISSPGKWLLIFLMLAGRLELYSILILFIPETWKK
ncbi:Trk potassium uptake system protein TrkH [hydrothermal vent metagenome]|uniref:Trk potassium uptake system protein TrkH n=1 Tax=hydrothermal vent metagenome TaxID=652676 RepID=A0A3B1D9Q8_9ZZZZ